MGKNKKEFKYKNYDKNIRTIVNYEIFGIVLIILAFGILFFDIGLNYQVKSSIAYYMVIAGLLCGIPAALFLLVLLAKRRSQRKKQVKFLYEGASIDNIIGDEIKNDELRESLEIIRESHEKEQLEIESEKARLEEEIKSLEENKQVDEIVSFDENKKIAPMEELEKERAKLLEERKQLEKDKLASEAFAKAQLESALLGKSQLDIMKAEKDRIAAILSEKERKERERLQRAKAYKETRRENVLVKKAILGRQNIEKLFSKYFIEVASCFLMNRDEYKSNFGIAPYNKVVDLKVRDSDIGLKAKLVMASTEDKLWRFCENLVDVERFFGHPRLFPVFNDLCAEKMSLVQISEKLHYMYLQQYKKDFVKNYTYREDFENLLILINHHYRLGAKNISDVFAKFPPAVLSQDFEIVQYLNNPELQGSFEKVFRNWEEFGFRNIYQALYICYIDFIKNEKQPKELATAVLKDCIRISRLLLKNS